MCIDYSMMLVVVGMLMVWMGLFCFIGVGVLFSGFRLFLM